VTVSRRSGAAPHRTFTRVGQFCATLTHRHSDEIDDRIRALLSNNDQWLLVARLSTSDRAHLLKVHDLLVSRGHGDPDLLRAALLHDVGKSNGDQRVRLWHRVARVLGQAASSRLWHKLIGGETGRPGGLYLAENHAKLGAASVGVAGASKRCCELIYRHEEAPPTGDAMLDALITADEDA
jgi:hypothetical protein